MNVEIENKCPRCGEAVFVAPMHAGGIRQDPTSREDVRAYDLALGYQCTPCGWYVIQPESTKLSAADFLTAAIGVAAG
jgi:hypothetical protein